MEIITADLYDAYPKRLIFVNESWLHFGKKDNFKGKIVTLKVHEDNSRVRKQLERPGEGKVLFVDGGGSMRCALVGDKLAKLAQDNGWEGIIVYGAIRDSKAINRMNVGIKALGTSPIKSIKRDVGYLGETLVINGVRVHHGKYLYADADGVLVSNLNLF
ncbi:MAG: ribonuclease E activity regulator RraA [Flavobacteriaceae bacterium]|nr:ribonuclease E activity regulator RraA [Flavobacteriaceae bacterium]